MNLVHSDQTHPGESIRSALPWVFAPFRVPARLPPGPLRTDVDRAGGQKERCRSVTFTKTESRGGFERSELFFVKLM